MKLLVTGGAGFIGSNFVRQVLNRHPDWHLVNLDKLTYAGNLHNLADVADRCGYRFVRGDIAEPATVDQLVRQGCDAIVNFAAETHVDRSIEDAAPFLRTNICGVQVLLEAARQHGVPRLLHISTDEVYGSASDGECFHEGSPLSPGSPYAASKAAADLLIQAFQNTYGLPVMIVRCTNNYGPSQFPEKLIPLVIANALAEQPVPVYGDGLHQRDWLYVEDYCEAIERVLENGRPGQTYNVSCGNPRPNLHVIHTILDQLGKPRSLMQFVHDRPGHDRRYALDSGKIQREIGWRPQVSLEEGLRRTIAWYTTHADWIEQARSGQYREYYDRHYVRRGETMKKMLAGPPPA
jgi:dTDP-glucose 4,6-dehydratase